MLVFFPFYFGVGDWGLEEAPFITTQPIFVWIQYLSDNNKDYATAFFVHLSWRVILDVSPTLVIYTVNLHGVSMHAIF